MFGFKSVSLATVKRVAQEIPEIIGTNMKPYLCINPEDIQEYNSLLVTNEANHFKYTSRVTTGYYGVRIYGFEETLRDYAGKTIYIKLGIRGNANLGFWYKRNTVDFAKICDITSLSSTEYTEIEVSATLHADVAGITDCYLYFVSSATPTLNDWIEVENLRVSLTSFDELEIPSLGEKLAKVLPPRVPQIVYADKLYLAKNHQLTLYADNMLRYASLGGVYSKISYFRNYVFDKGFIYKPTANMNNLNEVFEFDLNHYGKITKTVVMKSFDVVGDKTMKALFIGDSLTQTGVYAKTLIDDLGAVGITLTSLGTVVGTDPSANTVYTEGHSGWRAWDYVNLATGQYGDAGNNPFYNPATEEFDFAYYMTQQSYTDVDVVCLNLGTNDLIRTEHSTQDEMIASYDAIISSIHAFDSNITICIWLSPLRALTNENPILRDVAYETELYKLEEYTGRETSDKIYIVPVGASIDPYESYVTAEITENERLGNTFAHVTDNAHLTTVGYQQIADVYFHYFAYLATLLV